MILSQELQGLVKNHAVKINAPAWNLAGVVQVESTGLPFWSVEGQRVPPARPEGHYFYRLLKGEQRAEAVRRGLAHPAVGGIKVPSQWAAVYDMIERMKQINEEAALMSCSWGMGQVMGENYRDLGYASVYELVEANYKSADGQLDCMIRFIKRFSLVDEIQRGDWKGFAVVYNGPRYAMNRYDVKMAEASAMYHKLFSGAATPVQVRNEEVARIQGLMKQLGLFAGEVDGTEEQDLKDSIKAFQMKNGLVPDGLYGKMTSDAVDKAVAKQEKKTGSTLQTAGGSTALVATLGEQVVTQGQSLMGFTETLPYLKPIVIAVIVIGVAIVLYGTYKKLTAEDTE